MASLHATLVASDAQLVYDTLTRTALTAERDARARARELGVDHHEPGLDARRADALVALAGAGGVAGGAGDDRGGAGSGERRSARRRIGVIVGLDTLLGLSHAPGELTGYGALPASVCRTLAGDVEWQLLVADAGSGRLVGMGRQSYRPTRQLADFIALRDRVCAFPGCAVPAWRCDNDHRLAFDAGGATSAGNLQPLCRYHHLAKTHGGWTVARDPDSGATIWTSPAGMRYVVPPARYPPE